MAGIGFTALDGHLLLFLGGLDHFFGFDGLHFICHDASLNGRAHKLKLKTAQEERTGEKVSCDTRCKWIRMFSGELDERTG